MYPLRTDISLPMTFYGSISYFTVSCGQCKMFIKLYVVQSGTIQIQVELRW